MLPIPISARTSWKFLDNSSAKTMGSICVTTTASSSSGSSLTIFIKSSGSSLSMHFTISPLSSCFKGNVRAFFENSVNRFLSSDQAISLHALCSSCYLPAVFLLLETCIFQPFYSIFLQE